MKHYSDIEIESLISRFETRNLPKVEWTHEAHLVVAIWYCRRNDLNSALNLVREFIINHNESVGTPNSDTEGYHESITKFWLIIADRFISENQTKSISQVCNGFINSEFGESNYPLEYYSKELLFSLKARQYWMEPDLKELKNTLTNKN